MLLLIFEPRYYPPKGEFAVPPLTGQEKINNLDGIKIHIDYRTNQYV